MKRPAGLEFAAWGGLTLYGSARENRGSRRRDVEIRRPQNFRLAGCARPLDPWSPMILLIDNYDSFTYNLVQRLGEIDSALDLRVYRNDELTLDEIAALAPERIIISPGPCTPSEAGISVECVRRFAPRSRCWELPGASVDRAGPERPDRGAEFLMHGKTD